MRWLTVMPLLAVKVRVASLLPDLTIAAFTTMLPSLLPIEPAKPVAIVTLVPALRLTAMSLANMVESAPGIHAL